MTLAERFWSRVEKGPGCWEWQGHRLSGKRLHYGSLCIGKRPVPAHRVAWELTNGPIPDGLWVLHRCDNPPCVNPAHLFLGTVVENSADMIAKGRHCHGERSPAAKLTWVQVAEVRRLLSEGVPKAEIGRRFGVTRTAIYWIAKGRNWAATPSGQAAR